MKNYTYYRLRKQVIGIKVTKSTFKQAVDLVMHHGAAYNQKIDTAKHTISFRQTLDPVVYEAGLGDYITSENFGMRVYTKGEFEDKFTRIYTMPSWYYPTDDEVKVLECLNRDAEMCYPYNYICSETGLTREQAKKAIDNLRSMGAVEFWRGLMTDDGEVAGSGFCWGDPHKAEALLYRHYGEGRHE